MLPTIFAGLYLIFLSGCARGSTPPMMTGHFYMLLASERVDVILMDSYKMREAVHTKDGAVHSLEGTWSLAGDHIAFTPFIRLVPHGVEFHSIWLARAEYDLDGNLQMMADDDSNMYFEREHPFLLNRLSLDELLLVRSDRRHSFALPA
jgi:hypothetical protein